MIITFANSKGGVGKSTLATVVAERLLKDDNFKVELVDIDPRQDFSFFIKEWAKHHLPQQKASSFEVKTNINKALKEKEDKIIVIDTPPGVPTKATLSAISNADVLVIPVEILILLYGDDAYDLDNSQRLKQYVSNLDVKPDAKIILTLNKVSSYDSTKYHGRENEMFSIDILNEVAQESINCLDFEVLGLAESYKLRTNIFMGCDWDFNLQSHLCSRYRTWVETVIQTENNPYKLTWESKNRYEYSRG